MKRYISILLTITLLLTCMLIGTPKVYASTKVDNSRAIAIVFDNSGSMYDAGDQAWCRATYAMEVFASMLNAGDILQIYPMHPITVGGKEYTMENPFQITDASQAASIREIYTPRAVGTPIESVDCAVQGLQTTQADKKYMIVLTDGEAFYRDNCEMSIAKTKTELDSRFQAQVSNGMTVMYLGIGNNVVMPDTDQSEYFVKKQAKNSEDVLSALTDMCNQIFGRDTLPSKYISERTVKFDISMKKLIVFVQGENVSDVKIVGTSGAVGKQIGVASTQYGTAGCGNYESRPDTSLQGMMVTYTDCAAGDYTLEYEGNATSVEVYYEPHADLDFILKEAAGNDVDPSALYEGEYKVSFGMKDAKTGELISSELLGQPHYQGTYSINGQEVPITYDGNSGAVPVSLKMNDKFDAKLTVTYLSGYTISKDSSDYGWPTGGIQVVARPAGELGLEISGGDVTYSLQNLEEGAPYIAKVYYQGAQLTGSELESVKLKWEPETSNAEIKQEFADDHYKLSLHYKDPAAPQDTVCGECTVSIYAFYSAQGSSEAQTQCPLTYNINDDFSPLQVDLYAPENYILISQLEDSPAIVVTLKNNGCVLTPEDFAAVELQVECGGIEHTVTAHEQDATYLIKLLPTEGIAEGKYPVKVTALYTDHIGRLTQADDSLTITLSNTPLWVKWAIGLLFVLILAIIIWAILHIKVLPKCMHTTRKLSSMNFDGDDVTQATNFLAEIKKKSAKVQSQYAGRKFGISMDVTPSRESYLYKPQKRRSAEVKVASVKKFGPAKIQEAMIGSAKYVADETTGKLIPALPNQKPFVLTNGMMVKYSGTIRDAGVDKDFEVTSKLNFKKK